MKNIKLRVENIKKALTSVIAAGVVLVTGNMTVKAESTKVTAQDVVDVMMSGNRITAEITQEEADRLVEKAEEAILKEGANLLPKELEDAYNKENKSERDLALIAGLCDTFLLDGTTNKMTYPEAIQFENVCEDVCGKLMKKGHTSIYSLVQSERYKEETYTELEEIVRQANMNKENKKSTYVVALGTDLGFYDDCFIEKNPATGKRETKEVELLALGSAATLVGLTMKKKEEKGKTYTKKM